MKGRAWGESVGRWWGNLDALGRIRVGSELRDVPVAPAAAIHQLHVLAGVVRDRGAEDADASLESVEDDGCVDKRVRVWLRLDGEHAAAVGGGEHREPADVRPDVYHQRRLAVGSHLFAAIVS